MYVCAWVYTHVCVYLYLCSQVFWLPWKSEGIKSSGGRVSGAFESPIWILGNQLRRFCKNCKYFAIEPFPQPHKEYWTLMAPPAQLAPYVGAFRREEQSRILRFWFCFIVLTFRNYFVLFEHTHFSLACPNLTGRLCFILRNYENKFVAFLF